MKSVLKYAHQGKVLQQYFESRAFVQMIMGPLGSGKTTTSIAKLLDLICKQKVNKKGERKSRWAVIRNCFDDKTEVLTEHNGWQFLRNLLESDKVAMLDGDEMKFVKPSYYYRANYRGEMVGFENEGADFLVTPDHRLWVSKAKTRKKIWSPYQFMLAQEAFGQNELRVRRDSTQTGVDTGFSVEQFEWLGFWFAEGHIGTYAEGRRRFVVTQCKPDGVDYARRLFAAAGVPCKEQVSAPGEFDKFPRTNFVVCLPRDGSGLGNLLFDLLKHCGKATNKAVPSWVKQASPQHLRAFLAGFIAGDGHSKGGTTVAYCSSKQLADDLQEIAHRAGLVANVNCRDRRWRLMVVAGRSTAPTAVEYTVTFVTSRKYNPALTVQGYAGKYRGWYKQQYDGVVYCLEVPTHVVLVRRNGKAHWSSQTYPDLTNTTIRDWRQIIEPLRLGQITMGHPAEHKMDFDLPDRTRVLAETIFLALDKDEDVRKLRGMQLTGVWLNEAKEIPKSILDMCLARIDRYPAPGTSSWVGVFGDSNAWDSDHWLETIAEGKRQGAYKDYEIFVQPGAVKLVDGAWVVNEERENRYFLGPEYYRRQIEGKRLDWIKVNLANEIGYSVDGKAVHPEYSDTMHTAREDLSPAKDRVVHVGLDFGLTPAAAFTQKQSDGQWWVFDEIALEDGDATMLADEIKARMARWNTEVKGLTWVFRGDPSGDNRAQSDSNTAFQVMRAAGVPVLPCTTNDPVLRRAALDRPLTRMVHGKPGITFSPRCKVLRKGLAGAFHYKRVAIAGKEEMYRDVPNKTFHSHVCEALEYALMDAGEHAIVNPASGAVTTKPAIQVQTSWSPLDV